MKYISNRLKQRNKNKVINDDITLFKIDYYSSTNLILYAVGVDIDDAINNIGPLLDSKNKPRKIRNYTPITDWHHLLKLDPIKKPIYKSCYRRNVVTTQNFDCYYDEYLDEWFVVNKTTLHSIKLKNK